MVNKKKEKKCVLLLRLELDAGSVGLALSYSVTLMGMFQWGVRQSAEVENMVRGDLSFFIYTFYHQLYKTFM